MNLFYWSSVTESNLALSLHDKPMYHRQGVETRNMTLLGKPEDQEDNRLMSQNNQLVRV